MTNIGKYKDPEKRKKYILDYQAQWRNTEEGKIYKREYAREYSRKIRKEVLAHYGNKCVCCGETELAFLTFDHINNDGSQHRSKIKGANIPQWLKRNNFPKDVQILCHNCNSGKEYLGVCPHKGIIKGVIRTNSKYEKQKGGENKGGVEPGVVESRVRR